MIKSLFTLIFIGCLALISCKRNDCTDIDATNYNSKATSDDNSCTYIGNAIVWFDGEKWQEYLDSNISIVHCFIDSTSVGSLDVSDYTGIAPSCNSPKGITITQNLKKLKTKKITIKMMEPDSTLISTHEITFKANTCVPFQIPN